MIAKLVSFALQQRFLIVIASLALMAWGAVSFQKLPIDAYPDLSPTHVEIITQWPGHAAEEIERLVTIPIEIEMNGIPKPEALRSISLYGLSSVARPGIPPHERQLVFERFFRSTSARAMPGSGLGLAIVKQVVLKHGGALRVEDTVRGGQPPGTSIYVLLPGRLISATRPSEVAQPVISADNG